MGPATPGGPFVQVRFRVGYALVSWNGGAWRLTVRVDGFENEDRDGRPNRMTSPGWGLTTAAFWKPGRFVRVGIEYTDLRGDRVAAGLTGGPDGRDRRGVVELRRPAIPRTHVPGWATGDV